MLKLNILSDNKFPWINHPTYKNALENQDCGLDIPMLQDILVPNGCKAFSVNLGIKISSNHGYMLVPRSSISKTPLRLSNSIGIIDKNYRGYIIAKVDNISNSDFILEKDKCYFQIISFDGNLPEYHLVNEIDETNRGSGGFGSTTKLLNN